MKKSLKSFFACLLALMLVIPAFSGVMADSTTEVIGTLEAKETVRVDVSGIRNGRTFEAADVAVEEEYNLTDIVTIMVELDAAPAADVCNDLKAADSYRDKLIASQDKAVAEISNELGVSIEVTNNYTVLFNGFAFEGEYRLVEEINELEGVEAFVSPVWAEPKLFNTTSQVGATAAWDLDYSGEGTIVAIIDTGCKVDHPAFSVDPENVKFTRDDIEAIIEAGELSGSGQDLTVESVYYSAKIPFRWNYVENNSNVGHGSRSDHGTHVAGIAAGNGGEILGVAKDAQIAVMQVFQPSGGASWNQILPALEDCAVLGVEAANLSLGSPCGSEDPWYDYFAETLERAANAGVNLAMAAGNDYNAAMNNAWGSSDVTTGTWGYDGYNLVQNPDYGVVGSPSTWAQGISVAAVNNSKTQGLYVSIEGVGYGYTENEQNMAQLSETLGGQTLEYVMVPGYGTEEDFAQVDVEGKIALVSRGETNFVEKAYNAQNAGAVACIVYNNQPGSINMVPFGTLDENNNLIHDGNEGRIPHVAVTQEVGAFFAAAEVKEVYVSDEVGIYDAIGGDQPSDFSSWGTTATLAIKPEITAPGGQIYSSTDPNVSGTLYQTWNGTSMATPHIAGGMAIISAYVDEHFPNLNAAEKKEMVDIILMSTATPVYDDGGYYASVRDQGAGEMNLEKAITTTSYITVEGTEGNRPKLEVGDDPMKTGSYTLTFTVHNFGEEELSYTIQPSVLLDDIAILGYMDSQPVIVYTETSWDIAENSEEYLLGDMNETGYVEIVDALNIARYAMGTINYENPELLDIDCDGDVTTADALYAVRIALQVEEPVYGGTGYVDFDMPEVVTVPVGGETEVTVVINVSDEIKAYLDAYYTAGATIEGFIELVPVDNGVSLTVPYLGFYGDWNYSATVDRGYYYEDVQWNSNNYPNIIGYKAGRSIYGLGINPFIDTESLEYYNADRNAVSPNGDSFLDTVNIMYMGLLRNSYVRYVVLDSNYNELDVIEELGVCTKGFWDTSSRDQLGVNYGAFPSNIDFSQYGEDEIIIRIEARLDNDGRHTTNAFSTEDSENWKWDVPVYIDTESPVISNFVGEEGNLSFNVSDDHYVAYAAVYSIDDDQQLGQIIDETGVFENARGAETQISLEGHADTYVVVGDYAGNAAVYLWDGETLTLTDIQFNTGEDGDYQDGIIFGYGLNLQTTQWVFFESTNLSGLYNGEMTPSNMNIVAAGFDQINGYCYALANGNIYRYTLDMNTGSLGNRTTVGSTGGVQFNEMAYDNANGILFGVSGATNLYTIDVSSGACTSIGQIGNGIVAMDFDANGMLYFVDAYGSLCSLDIYGSGAITEICNPGYAPVDFGTGSFYNQSGCMLGNTFYWGCVTASQQKMLIRFDVTNGAYEEMGLIYQSPGLQLTGMFAIDATLSSVNFAPKKFSGEFAIAD